jgi:aryl-alcohol dehydrogenase-like predicted oxidoreductase
VLSDIGRSHGASAYQVALAWLLAKGPHVVPIPGASRVESIVDSAAAASLTLAPEEIARIDRLGR